MIRVLFIAGLALAGALAHAADPAAEHSPDNALLEEAGQLTELAKTYIEENNLKPAEALLEKLLSLKLPDVMKRDGLLALAELHTKANDLPKVITVYDDFMKRLPNDPATPGLHFKLGLLYRQTGASESATGQFYAVLNSALKLGADQFESYRDLTRRAQFEIAETAFLRGEHEVALKYYELVARLDLADEDGAKTGFRALSCLFALHKHEQVVAAARKYLTEHPGGGTEPEARHMSIISLRALDRRSEAIQETLALLKTESARAREAPEAWAFWQKTTGNQVANEFYSQGEFMNALTIYRALAGIKGGPDWQWPAVYQMALCFERLRLFDRAREAYTFIVNDAQRFADLGKPMSESLTSCRDMADWRRRQIDWQNNLEKELHTLLPPASDADLPGLPEQDRAELHTTANTPDLENQHP